MSLETAMALLLLVCAFKSASPQRLLTDVQGDYTPPPCPFNRVTMNFTVTSKGRQFDRLGLMYLGDIEVFRTSTAEPTANGIVWYVVVLQSMLSLPYLATNR